jgi:hypothetical protein
LSTRINITIPDELKAQMDEYNRQNPYNKIIVSREAQNAIYNKLKEFTAIH